MRARALLVSTLTAATLATGVAVASPALAAGAVANSCAVTAPVKVEHTNGRVSYLGCGDGISNVRRATVVGRPYFVKLPGKAPMCRQAGVWFYPNNRGYESTAVLTPTVRCR